MGFPLVSGRQSSCRNVFYDASPCDQGINGGGAVAVLRQQLTCVLAEARRRAVGAPRCAVTATGMPMPNLLPSTCHHVPMQGVGVRQYLRNGPDGAGRNTGGQ